ncbi:MAG: hypothetical protein U0527_12740 [Candidatus Eisenbacteria bacterium]
MTRSSRADVTLGFLVAYLAPSSRRALYRWPARASDPPARAHGALLLFAFFMISDPKTTPDSRAGRLLFAALVAAGAAFVPFVLYRTNGLLWSSSSARRLSRSSIIGFRGATAVARPIEGGHGNVTPQLAQTRHATTTRPLRRCSMKRSLVRSIALFVDGRPQLVDRRRALLRLRRAGDTGSTTPPRKSCWCATAIAPC